MSSPERWRTDFVRLLECELHELIALRQRSRHIDRDLEIYAGMLEAFLCGDTSRLRQQVESAPRGTVVHCLGEARLSIRLNQPSLDSLRVAKVLIKEKPWIDWRGEVLFVDGMAHEFLADYRCAERVYAAASEELLRIGAKKKSVKAAFNSTVMYSCLTPNSKILLGRYYALTRSALEAKAKGVYASGLLNLSWEWERLGALELAFVYARAATRAFAREFQSVNHLLSIAAQAHLCIRLGRLNEAHLLKEHLLGSEIPEVSAALALLEGMARDPQRLPQVLPGANPSWSERLSWSKGDAAVKLELGDRERYLLKILSRGPATRKELIQALYGTAINSSSAYIRFDALIRRFKRKVPMLQTSQGKRFWLPDVLGVGKHHKSGR